MFTKKKVEIWDPEFHDINYTVPLLKILQAEECILFWQCLQFVHLLEVTYRTYFGMAAKRSTKDIEEDDEDVSEADGGNREWWKMKVSRKEVRRNKIYIFMCERKGKAKQRKSSFSYSTSLFLLATACCKMEKNWDGMNDFFFRSISFTVERKGDDF